jgi:hypothetical protein
VGVEEGRGIKGGELVISGSVIRRYYGLLLTAYCLLLTAYCLLLTAYCLLLTDHGFMTHSS